MSNPPRKRGRPSQLERHKDAVRQFFDCSPLTVWSLKALLSILGEHCQRWELPQSQTLESFIEFLVLEIGLHEMRVEFPKRTYLFLTRSTFNVAEVAQSIDVNGYLSHRSALEIQGLATDILADLSEPRDYFFTVDSAPRESSEEPLSQDVLNSVFSRPPRVTNNYALIEDGTRLFYLNGRYSGQVGVVAVDLVPAESDSAIEHIHTKNSPDVAPYVEGRVTDIERTLIDCTVRPAYAGGVLVVARAYCDAVQRGNLDISRLEAILNQLDYKYPYHQVVGFYLERGGTDPSCLDKFSQRVSSLDFYLEAGYPHESLRYNTRWKVLYPTELDYKR